MILVVANDVHCRIKYTIQKQLQDQNLNSTYSDHVNTSAAILETFSFVQIYIIQLTCQMKLFQLQALK